jgi:hypothetical protein
VEKRNVDNSPQLKGRLTNEGPLCDEMAGINKLCDHSAKAPLRAQRGQL